MIIVIEKFPEPTILTDHLGNIIKFDDDEHDSAEELAIQCQEGVVVEI